MFRLILPLLAMSSWCCAQTITAPDTAQAGSQIAVKVDGAKSPRDFVSIVPKGSREGMYLDYQYASKPQLQLAAPAQPGDYEIRVLGADTPYATLARKALRLESVTVTLDAPAQVAAGAPIAVKWTGPANPRDYIGIANTAPKSAPYVSYKYTREGNPLKLTAPDEAGEYELRYFLGNGDAVVASKRITIGAVSASVSAPAKVAAGAKLSIEWQGPNQPRDFITMVKAGTPERRYERYVYTRQGNPATLTAPDEAGEYELRYATGQSYVTLARASIAVTPNAASVTAAQDVVAGTPIAVRWQGPNNRLDYITIVPKGAREGTLGNYGYTTKGNPTAVLAPLEAGDYELRYTTGQSNTTLARAAIHVSPGKQEPGLVQVTSKNAKADARAVEIILDASGSMLQRIGGQRRIDVAKQTLTQLTSDVLPAGTPFALRVFGREVDSCQTDLEIPVAPLSAGSVSAKIKALEAKNNAKTPIGASLDKVAEDLSTVRGERLVIVLTDGEETCGGDPAASIEKLRKSTAPTRVSIVGFAIDDQKLIASFRNWSDLGAGAYFDAKDAAGLHKALAQALQSSFEVVDAQGLVVAEGLVGGEPIRVAAGSYRARLKGQPNRAAAITVKPKETAVAQL